MAPKSVAFVPRVRGYQNRKVAVIFGITSAFLRLVCPVGVVMVLLFAVSLCHRKIF